MPEKTNKHGSLTSANVCRSRYFNSNLGSRAISSIYNMFNPQTTNFHPSVYFCWQRSHHTWSLIYWANRATLESRIHWMNALWYWTPPNQVNLTCWVETSQCKCHKLARLDGCQSFFSVRSQSGPSPGVFPEVPTSSAITFTLTAQTRWILMASLNIFDRDCTQTAGYLFPLIEQL